MSDERFDVVVIGSGPGGYVAAIRAAQNGLKTACVEMHKALGGTCLNIGCIPSKALLHTSEIYEAAKTEFPAFGIISEGLQLDLGAMMANKDKAVTELTGGVAFLFKKNKIEHIIGKGSIKGPGSVAVALADGGSKTLEATNIIIATGSDVASLPGIEIDGKRIVSSTEALELDKVPGHMVVIGGGIIGLEMGSVWRRLGTKVTVLEYRPSPALTIVAGVP